MMEFVSWDDDYSQYMEKQKPCSKPPARSNIGGVLKFSHHPILWENIEQKIENVKVIKILYDFFVGW